MNKTLVIFDFDYLYGTSMRVTSVCSTSDVYVHNLQNSGNSFLMECRCFCNLQEAIDIIERRIIPSDSDADFVTSCGESSAAAIVGVMLYVCYLILISDNSLIVELSLTFYRYLKNDLPGKSFNIN